MQPASASMRAVEGVGDAHATRAQHRGGERTATRAWATRPMQSACVGDAHAVRARHGGRERMALAWTTQPLQPARARPRAWAIRTQCGMQCDTQCDTYAI
eukprot:365414-Chlamydomonas_euryale.AAC.6